MNSSFWVTHCVFLQSFNIYKLSPNWNLHVCCMYVSPTLKGQTTFKCHQNQSSLKSSPYLLVKLRTLATSILCELLSWNMCLPVSWTWYKKFHPSTKEAKCSTSTRCEHLLWSKCLCPGHTCNFSPFPSKLKDLFAVHMMLRLMMLRLVMLRLMMLRLVMLRLMLRLIVLGWWCCVWFCCVGAFNCVFWQQDPNT